MNLTHSCGYMHWILNVIGVLMFYEFSEETPTSLVFQAQKIVEFVLHEFCGQEEVFRSLVPRKLPPGEPGSLICSFAHLFSVFIITIIIIIIIIIHLLNTIVSLPDFSRCCWASNCEQRLTQRPYIVTRDVASRIFWVDFDFGGYPLILGILVCIFRLLLPESIHLEGVWTRKAPLNTPMIVTVQQQALSSIHDHLQLQLFNIFVGVM